MDCDQRTELLSAYNRARLEITNAVQNLVHGGPRASQASYDLRRHTAERARAGFELADEAYEAHIQQHHCNGDTPVQ